MTDNHFDHPRRFPKNVEGPFYSTGTCKPTDGPKGAPLVWYADCLQCEAPENVAPDLLAELGDGNLDTYFVRQPQNDSQVTAACEAATVCCTCAIRYGGLDRTIIAKLSNNPDYCDYVDVKGELRLTVDENGELVPFAERLARSARKRRLRERRKFNKKWYQFWL